LCYRVVMNLIIILLVLLLLFGGAEHTLDVREAASTIAKAESQKRGWEKWQLNYLQQRNQGWMRVVVVEVTRE